MKQKVVIIGHGYSSRLGIVRSVAQMDCEVTVIVMTGFKRDGKTLNNKKPIDCYSKYVSHVYYCLRKDKEGLIRILLDHCIDAQQKVIIIPDSDFSASVIDQSQELLREHFLFPHINHTPGAVIEWMDKVKQKNLARELQLNVASSCVVEIKDGKYAIPVDVSYPCFTKPLSTINGGGKRIFRRCNNEAELRAALDLAGSIADMQVLIEEFKTIETEFAVVGFSDGKEVVIPAILQILEMAHGGHFGVACKGKIMPVDGFEELIFKFKQYVLKVGFAGVFDIDFYQSGGVCYFGEMNLRFGGSGYAVTRMGVNLPAMLVKSLCNESTESMCKEIEGTATYANDRMCMDDWYGGFISTKEYHQLIRTSDIVFIDDAEDKGPQKSFYREFCSVYFKRCVKRLFGKYKTRQ